MSDSEETIFGWITKYRPSENRNPREDMLTQAFASVLDAVDGLAEDLFLFFIDSAVEGDAAAAKQLQALRDSLGSTQRGQLGVTTQRSLKAQPGHFRFVDLEMDFSPLKTGDVRPDALIWVECKGLGTDFQTRQLPDYAKALEGESRGRAHGLFLLVPLGTAVPEDQNGSALGNVHLVDLNWQEVGLLLKEWADPEDDRQWAGSSPKPKEHERWLVEQFVNHLRNGGLLNDQPLEEKDVAAIESIATAMGRLSAVLPRVDQMVEVGIKEGRPPANLIGPGWRSPGLDGINPSSNRVRNYTGDEVDQHFYDLGWPSGTKGGPDYFLEWRLGLDSSSARAGYLGSGLTIRSQVAQVVTPALELPEDFSIEEDGPWTRVYEWRSLGNAAFAANDLETQAGLIAEWILENFRKVGGFVREIDG